MKKLICLLLLTACAPAAQATLEITITGGETRPVPIAAAPFGGNDAPGADTDIAAVVESDLVHSGLFSAIARRDMLEQPTSADQVEFRNWRALGAEHLVVGRLQNLAGGGASVRFQLLDVFRGSQEIGYEIPVASPDRLRYTAHQIADYIYQKLTGIRGYFNTRIAYVTVSGVGSDRIHELVVADADGYNPRVIYRSHEPVMSPAWSPDARRIAFVAFEHGRSSILIHELQSGLVRRVLSERGINGSPAWSPDGQSLAVTLSHESNPDIYVLDLATGARRRLTTDFGIDTEASWASDGKSLVFTSDRGGQPQIYQVDAYGTQPPQRLTFEGKQNLRARFSPDGTKLALVNSGNNGYRIAAFDLTTHELRILTDGTLDESPSFAPNGAMIIYSTPGLNGAELATVSVDGRVRQRLRQSGDVRDPAWSPYPR